LFIEADPKNPIRKRKMSRLAVLGAKAIPMLKAMADEL
jgi:hypothetical protein